MVGVFISFLYCKTVKIRSESHLVNFQHTICSISPYLCLGLLAFIALLDYGCNYEFLFLKSFWIIIFFCNIFRSNNWSFSDCSSIVVFGLKSIAFALGLSGFIYYFAGLIAGIFVLIFWVFVYYGLAMFYFYKSNNSSISISWMMMLISAVILTFLGSIVASNVIDNLDNYLGFSLGYLILNFFLFLYSFAQI